MRNKLAPLTNQEIIATISYSDGGYMIQLQRGITLAEFRELALNANTGQCPGCLWWCLDKELVPNGTPDGKCANCRIPGEDE